ncbi:MAG: MFS transporter [Caldilineales bacterium]
MTPEPTNRPAFTTRWMLTLNAGWFGLAYLWNGLHAILLPAMLIGLVPLALKNTYLGALTFFGLLLAMLTQPIAGAVSDRSGWMGRWGRRRPFVALGVALVAGLLVLLAGARSFAAIALIYAAMQVTASIAEAALQSLLPDQVPAEDRGRASGFKNAAQIAGFVVGVGVGGVLAGRGQIGLALLITALMVLATNGWTLIGVVEQPVKRLRRRRIGAADALRVAYGSFSIDRRAAPGYTRLLAGRALIMAGFFALQGFAQYFIADNLRAPDPAGTTALLMATMGVAVLVLAVPTGILADRLGRRPLNLFAGVLGGLATLALILVGTIPQLILIGGLVGAAVGIFLSVNWAWAADLVPPGEAGRYLGLSNLATAGASAFSRLLAGPLVDGGNALSTGLGYSLLFTLLAVGMFAGTGLLAGVPETRAASPEPVGGPMSADQTRQP